MLTNLEGTYTGRQELGCKSGNGSPKSAIVLWNPYTLGKMKYINGDTYEGEWKDGLWHGKGEAHSITLIVIEVFTHDRNPRHVCGYVHRRIFKRKEEWCRRAEDNQNKHDHQGMSLWTPGKI